MPNLKLSKRYAIIIYLTFFSHCNDTNFQRSFLYCPTPLFRNNIRCSSNCCPSILAVHIQRGTDTWFPKQRLKSALWYSIGKIVDEETLRLGVNATPQFIGSLTELTWAQIGRHSILLGGVRRSRQ